MICTINAALKSQIYKSNIASYIQLYSVTTFNICDSLSMVSHLLLHFQSMALCIKTKFFVVIS